MGTSYTTAPLHIITFTDYSAAVPLVPLEGSGADWFADMLRQMPGKHVVTYDPKSIKYITPSSEEIIAWRERLNEKYLDQFGQALIWDETSMFSKTEETYSSGDMLLSYIAAILDQRGESTAARMLLNTQRSPDSEPFDPELSAVFAEADRRKFSSRFPQILLRPHYWLPFERHLVIEEPDWFGTVCRFGSLFRFTEELDDVRRFISQADPRVMTIDPKTPYYQHDVLTAAWVVSECILRLANAAVRMHLPLWGNNR